MLIEALVGKYVKAIPDSQPTFGETAEKGAAQYEIVAGMAVGVQSFSRTNVLENEPVSPGIHPLHTGEGNVSSTYIVVWPFGRGMVGSQFSMRISGWTPIGDNPKTWIWTRSVLAVLGCMLGAERGFSGRLISDEERFCTYGSAVATAGNRKIQFEFVQFGEDHVGMNALWAAF